MFKQRSAFSLLCIAATATTLAACGGSGHKASTHTIAPASNTTPTTSATQAPATPAPAAHLRPGVAAIVGKHTISDAMLGEWMQEQVGEDYYLAAKKHRVPARLVHEPADIPACISTLQASNPPGRTAGQLKAMCERLYRGVKRETIQYLVSSYWGDDFAATHGVDISSSEIQSALHKFTSQLYKHQSEFLPDIAKRNRKMSQELFIVRDDLVSQRLLSRLQQGASSQLGKEALQNAETATCPPGFVVEHCIGYRTAPSPAEGGPSVAAMLEEIASWRGT